MKWYYAQDNQRHGPISENEFDFLVHQKKILSHMLVWNETMADWKPLREVLPEPLPPPLPYNWTAPASPTPVEHDGPAWEDRDRIGGLKAAVKTVGELLGNSDRAFARMKRTADWAGPFCFALFLGGVGYYVNLSYGIIYSAFVSLKDPGNLKGMALLLTTGYGAGFIIIATYFFIPVMFAFITLLNSVLIHFSLVLMGGVKQPFQATWRVVCYSFGTSSVFQVVPVLGFFLTLLWNLTLMIRGIAKMHEVSTGRAALALMPVALYTSFFILHFMGVV